MNERVQYIVGLIQESGPNGVDEDRLYDIIFVNLHCTRRTAKQYMDHMIAFGKIKLVGKTFISTEFERKVEATVQSRLELKEQESRRD